MSKYKAGHVKLKKSIDLSMHHVKDREKDVSLIEAEIFSKNDSKQKFDTNLNDDSTLTSLLNGSLLYPKTNHKKLIGTSKISPNVRIVCLQCL